MANGNLYRCQNPNCRAEVESSSVSIPKSANPTCSCGAPMKKVYTKPVVREMSREEVERFFPEVLSDEFSANSGKSR